jgi:hypothetical protein
MSNGAKSMSEHGRQYHSKNEMRNALFRQIASLELSRQRLLSQINSLSSFNSLLPADIRAAIFYEAMQLPCPLDEGDGKGEHSVITPFFLGKICRDWRDLVWSSPLLWTNIYLCMTRRRCKAQANLLQDWLSRTARCPLSFCLTSGEEPETWDYNPPMEILTIFVSVSERWKQAEFYIPDNQLWFDTISAAENSLPLLTTATVEFEAGSAERQPFNLFSTAPQLSALHLYQPRLAHVLAPWHQLREFTSEASETVDDIRKLLLKMPNLVRCCFKSIISLELQDLGVSNPSQFPALELLECLELSFVWTAKEAPQVLGPFKLPSLREVSLYGLFSTSLAWFPVMTSFQSSHLLEKFSLTSAITSDYDLIQILELIPSIKELRLEFIDRELSGELFAADLLQRLCPPHAAKFLPNLRSLTYDGPSSLNDHMDLFRDALAYRFRRCGLQLQPTELDSAVSQIQSVIVDTFPLDINPGIQEDLDSLRREGLELRLK